MDASDSYVVVERMLREGEVMGAELKDLLVVLERQGLINAEEHQSLLELAEELNIDTLSPS